MVGLMRQCVAGGSNLLSLVWIKYFLSPKIHVSLTDHVQDLKAPIPKYKYQWIPFQSHEWYFRALSMALGSSMVYLGPKAWSCS